MCVSTIIKPRELAVMSCVLVLSSSQRVSGHVMWVSTIIKPPELWLDDSTNTYDMTANSRGLMIVLTHMT
jgi:hypothetical protein